MYNVIAWSDTGGTIPIPFLSIMNDLVISTNLSTIEYAYYGQWIYGGMIDVRQNYYYYGERQTDIEIERERERGRERDPIEAERVGVIKVYLFYAIHPCCNAAK